MQPIFNIERDRKNELRCFRYRNDKCLFQFHSQIEIYFVNEGEMEMFVGGKYQTLKAGDVSVALSYDTHMYKTPAASRSAVILIPTGLCEEFLQEIKGKRLKTPFITDPAVGEELRRYFEILRSEELSHVRKIGYLYIILGLIVEHIGLEDATEPIDTELASQVLFYISENYRSEVTPASVAEHFGYSQSYLSRYFKACFNITLGKYITIVKLKSAEKLMREGKNDITYCAMESGFSSMRTFYRAFHNEFGCSPKEYMERVL